jgi:hypothetical protein
VLKKPVRFFMPQQERNMNTQQAPLVGVLSLSLLFAGCARGQSALPPAAPSQSLSPWVRSIADAGSHAACATVSSSQNFNATALSRGSYLWFSSQVSVPGYKGPLNLLMHQSRIILSDGRTTYTIDGPNMRFSLHGGDKLRLRFPAWHDSWQLGAPYGTAGNDFLNGIAYRFKRGLPGGIQNVTWSAKFSSQGGHQIQWQWAAAAYTKFTDKYRALRVKPLDDSHYRPYNSNKAGTPEAYKAYVVAGGTGSGGNDYTGNLSPPVTVTPCLK